MANTQQASKQASKRASQQEGKASHCSVEAPNFPVTSTLLESSIHNEQMRTNGRTRTTHTHAHTADRRTSEPLRSCIRAPRVESTALHCSFDQIKSSVCEAVFPQSIITHPSSFVVRRSNKQTKERTNERRNERTSTNEGRNEGTKERRNEGTKERRNEGTKERTKSERTKEGRKEGRLSSSQ